MDKTRTSGFPKADAEIETDLQENGASTSLFLQNMAEKLTRRSMSLLPEIKHASVQKDNKFQHLKKLNIK